MKNTLKHKFHITTSKAIIGGFVIAILIGALLLCLPISSKEGVYTPFDKALFTATSAVCVTGLVVFDTASYWSSFGQGLILLMIQLGGLGVLMAGFLFMLASGKKISLDQRVAMQSVVGSPRVGGIVKISSFIFISTIVVELTGAILLMPVLIKEFGLKGIWLSLFHSVSAFCNAGFDLMGSSSAPFQSLTAYSGNIYINVIIMLLIILGGLGFLVWTDVLQNGFKYRKYRLQTKVVLVTSFVLIVFPSIFYFLVEYADLGLKDRFLASIFQSVTTRTAGFNTMDFNEMTPAGKGISIILMLIGGSPGSTAGGFKTTTIAVLMASLISDFRRRPNVELFKRTIDNSAVRNAASLLTSYVILAFSCACAISMIDNAPFDAALFETSSAIGTVGLSLGLTPSLSFASRMIIIVLMFFGRVGILSLVYAAVKDQNLYGKYPVEKINVG